MCSVVALFGFGNIRQLSAIPCTQTGGFGQVLGKVRGARPIALASVQAERLPARHFPGTMAA